MNFKYGFEYNGVMYGWYKKELYRLPYTKSLRSYNLKKINPVIIGSTTCYNVFRIKFTINKLEKLTQKVNWCVNINEQKDCPF